MAKTYTLNVAGLTRELTICKVNDHMDIAAFIMLGDAELAVAAAAELLKKCPDFDILLTAEAKGIPLAHEMSRQSGKPYVCARKGEKLYMTDPVGGGGSVHYYRRQAEAGHRPQGAGQDERQARSGGGRCHFHWRFAQGSGRAG